MKQHITINGKTHELKDNLTLDLLINQLELTPNTFAIAINETFVPMSQYTKTKLNADDRIEIVTAMQGG